MWEFNRKGFSTNFYNFGECERNPLTSIYFLLGVKFENVIVGLHVLIIFSMLANFQENQRSIAI